MINSPLDSKEIQPVHPKGNQSWILIGRTDAEAETLILWPPDAKSWLIGKDPERLKAGGEGDNRGWDGWMVSLTQWTWVWVSSGSWWWTGKPGVLQSVGSQTVEHDWVTELNWTTHLKIYPLGYVCVPGYAGHWKESVEKDPFCASRSSREKQGHRQHPQDACPAAGCQPGGGRATERLRGGWHLR